MLFGLINYKGKETSKRKKLDIKAISHNTYFTADTVYTFSFIIQLGIIILHKEWTVKHCMVYTTIFQHEIIRCFKCFTFIFYSMSLSKTEIQMHVYICVHYIFLLVKPLCIIWKLVCQIHKKNHVSKKTNK